MGIHCVCIITLSVETARYYSIFSGITFNHRSASLFGKWALSRNVIPYAVVTIRIGYPSLASRLR